MTSAAVRLSSLTSPSAGAAPSAPAEETLPRLFRRGGQRTESMPASEEPDPLDRALRGLRGPVVGALQEIPVAIWIADCLGRVHWMNTAASSLLGAKAGSHFSRFIASEGVANARELFARTIHGGLDSTVQQVMLSSVTGPVAAELTSAPIREEGRAIGVITLVRVAETLEDPSRRRAKPRLTPRQHQILELLAHGRSTDEIAEALQISEHTVRNHVRYLLAELRVRTRLEAVVVAFRNGWL